MLQHSKQNTAIFLNFKSSLYEMAKYIPKVVTYEKHNDSWQDRLQDVSVHNIVLVHHHLVEKITSTNGTFIVIVIVFAIECFYAQHGTGSASMHGLNMLHLHPLSQKLSKDSTLGPISKCTWSMVKSGTCTSLSWSGWWARELQISSPNLASFLHHQHFPLYTIAFGELSWTSVQ